MPASRSAWRRRDATIQVFYDKSNPVTSAIARSAIQNIVAGLNRSLQASGPDPVKLEESEVEAGGATHY